jgi:hypothetical protein
MPAKASKTRSPTQHGMGSGSTRGEWRRQAECKQSDVLWSLIMFIIIASTRIRCYRADAVHDEASRVNDGTIFFMETLHLFV